MAYEIYRSDGIPLAKFDRLLVYRNGIFVMADKPRVNDIVTIDSPHQSVTYCISSVEDQKAYTIQAIRKNK